MKTETRKHSSFRRLIALILCAILVFGVLPAGIFAEGTDPVPDNEIPADLSSQTSADPKAKKDKPLSSVLEGTETYSLKRLRECFTKHYGYGFQTGQDAYDWWVSEGHLYTAQKIEYTDYYGSHNISVPLNPPGVEITAGWGTSSQNPDQVKITDAGLYVSEYGRSFVVLTALDLDSSDRAFCDITIEPALTNTNQIGVRNSGFDVFLVNFGTYNQETGKARKGIRNITIDGYDVRVYFVNSNLGYTDKNGTITKADAGSYGGYYDGYRAANSMIVVKGEDSHIYMDRTTNAAHAGEISCYVCIQGEFMHGLAKKDGAPDYWGGNRYNPRDGLVYFETPYTGYKGSPVSGHLSTVELANLRIVEMGNADTFAMTNEDQTASRYPNGVLDGISGVVLYNCKWAPVPAGSAENPSDEIYIPLENITLSDLAHIMLIDCNNAAEGYRGSFPTIVLKDRATAAFNGENYSDVISKGKSSLYFKGGTLHANVLISDEFDVYDEWDDYESIEPEHLERIDYITDTHISNRARNNFTGAEATIFMSGNAAISAPSENNLPGIMVDSTALLYIKDDATTAGIGSLSVSLDYYQNNVAAIGGTPSLDPKPHGVINIFNGVLTASTNNGSAAIGGSTKEPYIVYKQDGQNNQVIDTDASMPGFSRDAGEFAIVGGVVNVTATEGGAGIGGADGGNGGRFWMNGGTVNANVSGFGEDNTGLYTGHGFPAAAIGGGATVYSYNSNGYKNVGYLNSDGTDPIYVKGTYSYVSGGNSGIVTLYGGVVNASAENPCYDSSGEPIGSLKHDRSFYRYENNQFVDLYNGLIYGESGYPETVYFVATDETTHEPIFVAHPWADIYAHGDDGRSAGYVIGNASGVYEVYANIYNDFDLHEVGGLIQSDGTPVVNLKQIGTAHNYSADHFFMPHSDKNILASNGSNTSFQPSTIGKSVILTTGYSNDRYVLNHNLGANRTYRLRGQITLWDEDYGGALFEIPDGCTLDLLSGSILSVPGRLAISALDEKQLIAEAGSVIQGKGLWPGKPVDPENPPSYNQVRSLIKRMTDTTGEGSGSGAAAFATHLGIGNVNGGGYALLPGNSAAEVQVLAERAGTTLVTILNAGDRGFKQTVDTESSETWRLADLSEGDNGSGSVISLTHNGALVATPDSYTTPDHKFDIILSVTGGSLTAKLQSAKLSTPDYVIYDCHQADDELTLKYAPSKDLALKITFSPDQVTNNDAVFSVPKFQGSEFSLNSVSALRDKCSVRYGGTLSFTTPVADFANITINELQIKYGGGIALEGINGSSSVMVPAIAGFPVKGNAFIKLNTFAPKRELSMSVSLDTPIFSGAFEASFKETRGVIIPDTLYAELAVDEAGIPLVPPTVVGYLQGGGLGISGLADTVGMDSFGAPPVRLNIAAKGSILDVIEGWARVSVGMDGFDLQMTDMEIADFKIMKELGISAKWSAGNKTIKGRTYWGIGTDMSAYIVIAVPVPGVDSFNEATDTTVALISASGEIKFGGFTGYYKENNTYYFIYQLSSSGSLSGTISIPKKIIGGTLPIKNFKLADAQLGFYAAANATSKVDASKVDGSPTEIVRQLASSADIDFDAAVGAQVTVGGGSFLPSAYVRLVYVLGDKWPKLDGGLGSGGKLNLEQYVSANPVQGNNYASFASVRDPETGEIIPTIVEVGAKTVAALNYTTGTSAAPDIRLEDQDVILTRTRSLNSFNVTVSNANAIGNIFLAITLDDANATLTTDQLTVTYTQGGDPAPVTLNSAKYDENGNQTEATKDANFFADAGVVYFAPNATGTYTVTSSSAIEKVEVIQMQPFAGLDQTATSVQSSGNTSYKIDNADAARKYKVQLVLGTSKGVGDYLLAETDVLTGTTSGAYSGNITLTDGLTGSLAPTGAYYPSVLMLEYVEATDEAGNAVATWTLVDQKNLDTTVTYTNNVIPAAPSGVTLAYTGNGTMTASWTAPSGVQADAYQISVYDQDGNDTGLLFQTSGDVTSIIMDLSSLYASAGYLDATNPKTSFSVGVKAKIYDNHADQANSTYQLGYEGRSAQAQLKPADPPRLVYSDNIVLGEGNSHILAVKAAGGSFAVGSDREVNFIVTDASAPATVYASQNNANSVTVTVPAKADNKPLTLQVLATDANGQDYALSYITVNYDTAAPSMVLDHLGEFTMKHTDAGFQAEITGNGEAGASVYVYSRPVNINGNQLEGDFELITGGIVAEDGTFAITITFADEPLEGQYCVRIADKAGNISEAQSVYFRDADVTVILDPNNDSAVCSIGSVGLTAGAPIGALPEPLLDGKVFTGWYTEAEDGEGTLVDSNTRFEEDAIIYAHWVDSVGITFRENNQEVLSMPIGKGMPIGKLPEPVITYDNKIFLGWQAGGEFLTESSVFNGNNHNINAVWVDAVTVTFDAGLGNSSTGSVKIPVGTAIAHYPDASGEDPEVTATGYTFDGWFTEKEKTPGETPVPAGTTYDANTTLYAHWTRNTAAMTVTQESWEAGNDESIVRPDPVFTAPQDMIGVPSVTYVRTVAYTDSEGHAQTKSYTSFSKPTEPGTYKVIVQCDTYEKSYTGRAEFTVFDAGQIYSFSARTDCAGQSMGDVTTNAADTVHGGDSITVTVTAVQGYTFDGWYIGDDKVSSELSYTFVIGEDTELVARYIANGSVQLTIDCSSEYTINGSAFIGQDIKDYMLGTTVTVSTDDSNFAYWENDAHKVLSRSSSYTFAVTNKQTIRAVFNSVVSGKVRLIFESLTEQVMATTQLASGDTMELPAYPSRNGYDPVGWDLNCDGVYDENDTLANAIALGLETADKVLTIKPLYTLRNNNYTVTVTGGTGGGTYRQNDLVTVTADAPEADKKFSHWIDGSGKILGYRESYSFYAEKDIALTAVFVDDAESVEAVGTTAIINMSADPINKKLTFVSMSTVPEGCTIDKAGVIATSDAAVAASGDGFNADTAMFVRGDAWNGESYRFTWNKTKVEAGTIWYVRAYLVYTDAQGNQRTIYGEVVQNSYSSGNA